MRYGRAKAARRTLQFFERTVGLKAPYNVLLDGPFLVSLVKSKLTASEVRDRLDRLVHRQTFYLAVTQSTLDELQRLEKEHVQLKSVFQEARDVATELCRVLTEIPTCSEKKPPRKLSAVSQDLWRCVRAAGTTENDNVHPIYLVATQDEDLLDSLRSQGTCPIVRWAQGSVLLLEAPSKAAQSHARYQQRKVLGTTEAERALVTLARQEGSDKPRAERQQSRKPKKAKGPNPLSCKKKQPAPTEASSEQPPKKKRRKRKTAADMTASTQDA